MAHPNTRITRLRALAPLSLSACQDAKPLRSDTLHRDPAAETVADLAPHDIDADTRSEDPAELLPYRCAPDTRACTHTPCLDYGSQICIPSPNLGWLCSRNGWGAAPFQRHQVLENAIQVVSVRGMSRRLREAMEGKAR